MTVKNGFVWRLVLPNNKEQFGNVECSTNLLVIDKELQRLIRFLDATSHEVIK